MIRLTIVLAATVLVASIATSGANFTRQSTNPANSLGTLLVRPPTGIGAASLAGGEIQLSWAASPTDAGTGHVLSYVVFRGPIGGPYVRIGSTVAGVLAYRDTPAGDGTYSYVVQAQVSGSGSFQSVDSGAATSLSDRTPPAMSITCNGGACGAGWYNAPVLVTANGVDAGVGMGSVSYRVDAGTSASVPGSSASFSVSGDSAGHTVGYWGQDTIGNTSATGTQTIRIDATAPTAPTSLASTQGTKGAPATINLTWTGGSDATSGIQGYVIYWSNAVSGGTCPAISPANYPNSTTVGVVTAATIPPSGTLKGGAQYCAYLVSIDNAGNQSAASGVTGPTKAN